MARTGMELFERVVEVGSDEGRRMLENAILLHGGRCWPESPPLE